MRLSNLGVCVAGISLFLTCVCMAFVFTSSDEEALYDQVAERTVTSLSDLVYQYLQVRVHDAALIVPQSFMYSEDIASELKSMRSQVQALDYWWWNFQGGAWYYADGSPLMKGLPESVSLMIYEDIGLQKIFITADLGGGGYEEIASYPAPKWPRAKSVDDSNGLLFGELQERRVAWRVTLAPASEGLAARLAQSMTPAPSMMSMAMSLPSRSPGSAPGIYDSFMTNDHYVIRWVPMSGYYYHVESSTDLVASNAWQIISVETNAVGSNTFSYAFGGDLIFFRVHEINRDTPLDADGDGMDDLWEYTFGFNAMSDDASGDLDLDGQSNLIEYQNKTHPDNNDTNAPGVVIVFPSDSSSLTLLP